MNNLHLSLTDFRNESRVIKEANSIANLCEIDHVFIAALHSVGQSETECINDKVSVHRFVLKTRGLSKGLLTQLIKYIEFTYRVFTFYREKKILIINVHSLALLPLGYFLKLFYSAKLIYDTHELETETNGSKGVRKLLAKFVEKILIRKTDHVFVVSESIADWYKKAYNINRPTVVLNVPKICDISKKNYFRDDFKISKDQIIVLYQGGLCKGRGVELLLNSFSQRVDDKVVIIFMGYGELEDDVKQIATKSNRIFFHSAVPPDEVLSFTASADIGVSFIENTCLSYYYCLPNKLFEYAMVGLPVIVSDMKEMRDVVEKYNMGLVVDGDSVEEINSAIDSLLLKDLKYVKLNARNAAIKNAWENQEKKLHSVYKTYST